jgi:hypothetical protein
VVLSLMCGCLCSLLRYVWALAYGCVRLLLLGSLIC